VGCDIKYLGAPSCLAYAGSFVVYSPPPALEPHLRASFSRHRAKFFCHRGNIYLPAPSLPPKATFPLFLLAFQVQTFTAAYWQLSLLAGDPSSCSAASSPATLLLAAPPPRRRPFFLQRRLLAGDPSSCCAASSIWSGNPHPTHTILLLSRPTCPDRRSDTFHRNHCPPPPIKRRPQPFYTQYNVELSSMRPHARTRSLWLPCVSTARSWRSTSSSRPPSTPPRGCLL
jgi:hypothetical protein